MTTPMTPKELTPEQIDNIEEYVLRHVENPHDLDIVNLIYTYRHLESLLSDSQKEVERLTKMVKVDNTIYSLMRSLPTAQKARDGE